MGVSATPVHSQARRDLFGAEETTQNMVEIPTFHVPVTDETFRKLECGWRTSLPRLNTSD